MAPSRRELDVNHVPTVRLDELERATERNAPEVPELLTATVFELGKTILELRSVTGAEATELAARLERIEERLARLESQAAAMPVLTAAAAAAPAAESKRKKRPPAERKPRPAAAKTGAKGAKGRRSRSARAEGTGDAAPTPPER